MTFDIQTTVSPWQQLVISVWSRIFSLEEQEVVNKYSTSRTVNATAELRIQSANLSVGFPAKILQLARVRETQLRVDEETTQGDWYQVKTNEGKDILQYILILELGFTMQQTIHKVLNQLQTQRKFWLKIFEDGKKLVRLSKSSGTGNSFVFEMVLFTCNISEQDEIFDSSIKTQNLTSNICHILSKHMRTKFMMGQATLEAFNNFASAGLLFQKVRINFDWKPLANSSGVAVSLFMSMNVVHIPAIQSRRGYGIGQRMIQRILDLIQRCCNNSIGKFPNAR